MSRDYRFVGHFMARILRKLHVQNICCQRCGRQIEKGDLVHVTAHGKKIYHFECFKSMFFDPSIRRRSTCLKQVVPS